MNIIFQSHLTAYHYTWEHETEKFKAPHCVHITVFRPICTNVLCVANIAHIVLAIQPMLMIVSHKAEIIHLAEPRVTMYSNQSG